MTRKMTPWLVAAALVIAVSGPAFAQSMSSQAPSYAVELFFDAASSGDTKTLNEMINQYPDIVYARHARDGKTGLHVAAMVGKMDAVKMLLNRGSEVNAKDVYKKTPYYYARIAHWYKVAGLIRSRGGRLR